MTKKGAKVKTPSVALLKWYDTHRREMPWRAKAGMRPDPYHVWLSEIMLQQTTVVTVAPYFVKFLKRWPNLEDLATADLDDVNRLWAGLGYYRRAKMLHQCARKIVAEYGGRFPETYESLLDLPGFGPYTAAAVAAIAFDNRANVVDGNVERVVARLFALCAPMPAAKKKLREKAEGLLPESRFGDYAQAMMDLGATVCTPRSPKCDLCPVTAFCEARKKGIAETLPRREKPKAKRVRRAVAFILSNDKGEILLRKRPETGVLAGMMEVPTSAWQEQPMPVLEKVLGDAPATTIWRVLDGTVRHVFSHFDFEIRVAVGKQNPRVKKTVRGVWIHPSALHAEALPSVMRKILRHGVKV